MSNANAIASIEARAKEAKDQKVKDLKASIAIATNTIRIVENAEIKGRDSFVVIDSLSWLHTIKQSLDIELAKIEPKLSDKGDGKKEPGPNSETPVASEDRGTVPPAETEKTLEVVK